VIIFTIIARNYLAHARQLMRSIAKTHPQARRVVVLVDSPAGYFEPEEEPFETISSSELDIPKSPWFHFKYSVLELSTAVKPYAFTWLWRKYGTEPIVYLDPDITVFRPMDEL
jgi:hypothetical protein